MPVPFIADLVNFIAPKKTIITYHNDLVKSNWVDYICKLYYLLLGNRTLKTSKGIIATSDYYVNKSPYLKKFKSKIAIVSPGVDLNVFNNTFNDHKEDVGQEIITYQEPQALSSAKQNFQELGGGTNGDYSNSNNVTSKMGYTDYRKAHTQTTLINPNSVNVKQYSSVEELNKARSKKTMLTQEEMMVIERNKAMEKDREEERLIRLNQNDEMAFRQFERVNKMFLK